VFATDRFYEAEVVVSAASRSLRRQLRPLVWVTLEEVALDAVVEDGRLVSRTSARRVADRLGIDPGTASRALGDLRRRGMLVLEREHDAAGRFGLSVYVLGSIAGLRVLSPCVEEPCADLPRLENSPVGSQLSQSTAIAPLYAFGNGARSSTAEQCPGQPALDLGSASS